MVAYLISLVDMQTLPNLRLQNQSFHTDNFATETRLKIEYRQLPGLKTTPVLRISRWYRRQFILQVHICCPRQTLSAFAGRDRHKPTSFFFCSSAVRS